MHLTTLCSHGRNSHSSEELQYSGTYVRPMPDPNAKKKLLSKTWSGLEISTTCQQHEALRACLHHAAPGFGGGTGATPGEGAGEGAGTGDVWQQLGSSGRLARGMGGREGERAWGMGNATRNF